MTTTNPNINSGQSTTLTPLFSNATTVTIDGSSTTPSGGAIISNVAFSVSPTVDKTYILLVTNSLGVQASASVTIYVGPALTIPSALTDLTGYHNGFDGMFYRWYISWNVPPSNGNTDIIGYAIYDDGTYIYSVGPSTLEYTYYTTEYAYARIFEVRAENSIGFSINNLVIELTYS